MRWLIALLCISLGAAAQNDSTAANKKLRYYNTTAMGVIIGSNGSAYSISNTSSLGYNQWRAGIGIALDDYVQRSLPVYLQLQYQVKNSRFYLWGDGGRNLRWKKSDIVAIKNGWYAAGGVYFKAASLNKGGLFIAPAYSVKTYREENNNTFPCLTRPCPVNKETLAYTLRRVQVALALQF